MLNVFSCDKLAAFLAEKTEGGIELQGIRTNLGHNKASLSVLLSFTLYVW